MAREPSTTNRLKPCEVTRDEEERDARGCRRGSRKNGLAAAWAWMASTVSANHINRISGLVVEYIVAIDVTRVRFPADALRRLRFAPPNHGNVDQRDSTASVV